MENNCCSGCNRPDLPWSGRGTSLPISGCRFSLYPMSDQFIDLILGSLEKTDTSAVWSESDALSTVYRGKIEYVADGDVTRYAGDILDYMQHANLLVSYNNKEFFINHSENEAILKYVNSSEWFAGYDKMIQQRAGTIQAVNNCRCDWFIYVNRETTDTDFATDITAFFEVEEAPATESRMKLFAAYMEKLKSLESLKTKDIGDIGESLVHGHECQRLKIGGREDLVHLVKKIPTELGVGYDISSRELDDTIRNIEVKTTISSKPIVFNKVHLTPNEWQAAKSYKDRYFVYRLMVSKSDIKLYILQNPVDLFKQDLIDITPREGMEVTFRESAGHYEELLAWEEC